MKKQPQPFRMPQTLQPVAVADSMKKRPPCCLRFIARKTTLYLRLFANYCKSFAVFCK
jgi:hypothetical protein